MWSGALDRSGVLLSYPVMPLASNMTYILISTFFLSYIFMRTQPSERVRGSDADSYQPLL